MTINSIAIITLHYPTENNPGDGAFIEQFVSAIARSGVRCIVIHPVRFNRFRNMDLPPKKTIITSSGSAKVIVYRPRFISFSYRHLGKFNTGTLTQKLFEHSTWSIIKRLDFTPDIIYGHFFYPSGAAAARIGKRLKIPSFVASGESIAHRDELLWGFKQMGLVTAKKDFSDIHGVIAVSPLLKIAIMNQLELPEDKIKVFQNGVDLSLFHPRDRDAIRSDFGLSISKFIVSYVGNFNYRKGIERVEKAIAGLYPQVGAIYLGKGSYQPHGPEVLYSGSVPHYQVPKWLSAADVFVLPTLAEGCSNAILEAMACGLPIITSNMEFNDGVLDDKVALLIDPLDPGAIKDSILKLLNNPQLMNRMRAATIERANKFDINLRADNILTWISGQIYNDLLHTP